MVEFGADAGQPVAPPRRLLGVGQRVGVEQGGIGSGRDTGDRELAALRAQQVGTGYDVAFQ